MPSVKDQSFNFTWRVEDFSLWAGDDLSEVEWPWTPVLEIEALDNTDWRFELCPRTSEDTVAMAFTRHDKSEALRGIYIDYDIYVLRKDGSIYYVVKGTLIDIEPRKMQLVHIMLRADLREVLQDDGFSIACEIRQWRRLQQLEDTKLKWEDEFHRLSDDMQNLFESGNLSDLLLLTDDDRKIAVHSSVLLARWINLRHDSKKTSFTNRIAVHNVSGSTLAAFVSYLYTGKLPGAKVTLELFDFAVKNDPSMRTLFHSLSSDICIRTKQRKEHLTFTWDLRDIKVDAMPFFRVLSLQDVDGEEIIVNFSTEKDPRYGELYLAVSFYVTEMPTDGWICFRCNGNLKVDGVSVKSCSSEHHFLNETEWQFPNFIPMRLLTNSKTHARRTVEFELFVSDEPRYSIIESSVTEFHTDSRGIIRMEWLASDFCEFFMRQSCNLYDVTLRTNNGCFSSCKVLLGARSKTFRRFFQKYRKHKLTLGLTETDSLALAGVLEYMYTGWTNLESTDVVWNVYNLAIKLSLSGLVEKCQQFFSMNSRALLGLGKLPLPFLNIFALDCFPHLRNTLLYNS